MTDFLTELRALVTRWRGQSVVYGEACAASLEAVLVRHERASPPREVRPRLTLRQAQVLAHVVDTVAKLGIPPTNREIGAIFGLRSTNGVNDHLKALERKGYLRRIENKSRGLVLIQPVPDLAWAREHGSDARGEDRSGRHLPAGDSVPNGDRLGSSSQPKE